MYNPPSFTESDPAVMFDFIAAHPLGALVTSSPAAGLFATHLPLLIDRGRGAHGFLQGHIARANPHHRLDGKAAAATIDASVPIDAMVIFTGHDAYVTPSWYPAKQEHGKVVPTWNYVAVHVYGALRFIDDRDFLMRHLDALTNRHEASQPHPWAMHDAPLDFVEALAKGTIGLELEITRLEGKWKMSQNRSAADVHGVVHGLSSSSSPHAHDVASIVAARKNI